MKTNNKKLFNRRSFPFHIILLISLSVNTHVFSQEDLLILEEKLKKAEGTVKVDLLNQLALLNQRISLDKAKQFAEEALKLSEKINYSRGKAAALKNIGFNLYLLNQLEKAEQHYSQALNLLLATKDSLELPELFNNIGLIYWRKNQFTNAFELYKRAQHIAKKMHDKKQEAQAINYIGLIFWKWTDYARALNYFFNSLKLKEELRDDFETGVTLNNIAFIYNEVNQPDLSIEQSNRALQLSNRLNNKYVLGRALNNLGASYFLLQDFNKAVYYLTESLNIKTEASDKSGMAYALNDLGKAFFAQKKYSKSENYFEQALAIRKELEDKYGTTTTLLNLAKVFRAKRNYTETENLLNEVIQNSLSIKNKDLEADAYKEYSRFAEDKGDLLNALKYINMYSAIMDTILNEKTRDKMAELSVHYDVEAKEKQLELLSKEAKIQHLEIEKEQNKNTILILAGAFIILILIALTIRYRFIKSIKNQLEEKNKEIAKKSLELEEALATKNKFFSIISHDLKSPFNGLKGITQALIEDYKELDDEKILEYLDKISKSSKEIYMLLENLLEWSRIQTKRIDSNPRNFDVSKEILNALNLLQATADRKEIELINNVKENTLIYADPRMISVVIFNFISNAIKFSHKGGIVKIFTRDIGPFLEISVKDSGMGISKEIQEKLFRVDSKYSSLGTNNETGTGLGLIISKEMIEMNGGEIYLESEEGKGTTFSFSVLKQAENSN